MIPQQDQQPEPPEPERDEHDLTARKGMIRGTIGRTTTARCVTCRQTWSNLGAALSHGRSARHAVEATYSATYIYVASDEPGAP